MSTDQPAVHDRGSADDSIEARLDALERASAERAAELRDLAAAIPSAVSRRALLAGAAHDLRAAPNKGEIMRRAWRKLLWAPVSAARRLKQRFAARRGSSG